MEESSGQVVKRVLPICSLLLISGWFLSTFLPRGDSWGLFGILLGITLCCFWRKAPIKFSIIDAGVIIIWLYDLASLLWSINSSPTIISLYLGTTAAACYFLVRHISQTEKYFRWLLGFFCSIIGIVVAIGLGTFWLFISFVIYIGLSDLLRTIGPVCYGFSVGSSQLPIRFLIQSEYNGGFLFSGAAFYF